jgi:hypothetical protein
MTPRVLIIFGTSYGQTEKIGNRIAAELQRRGIAVELCNAAQGRPSLTPEQYSGVVVGAVDRARAPAIHQAVRSRPCVHAERLADRLLPGQRVGWEFFAARTDGCAANPRRFPLQQRLDATPVGEYRRSDQLHAVQLAASLVHEARLGEKRRRDGYVAGPRIHRLGTSRPICGGNRECDQSSG